jgi:tetratricopeptide (TPR) repeat protein
LSAHALGLAARLLETGRPQQALDVLDGVGVGAPDAELFLLRARALLLLDDDRRAREAAQRGLSYDAASVPLWTVLAEACRALADLPSAERAVLSGLQIEPSDTYLLCLYASVLAEGGQDAKANRVLARAEQLDPGSSEVLSARAYVAFARGDDAGAARHARRALANEPESVRAHWLLGAASMARGEAGTAARSSRRAAASMVGNSSLAEMARDARLDAHWTMLPYRLITRWGPAAVWVVAVAILLVSGWLLPSAIAGGLLVGWLAFCVYTWIARPLLVLWARWRW